LVCPWGQLALKGGSWRHALGAFRMWRLKACARFQPHRITVYDVYYVNLTKHCQIGIRVEAWKVFIGWENV
jgi:hypothetical protein